MRLLKEHFLYTCFKKDFQMKIILETQVMAHQQLRCNLPDSTCKELIAAFDLAKAFSWT